jgi:hypothetical protein
VIAADVPFLSVALTLPVWVAVGFVFTGGFLTEKNAAASGPRCLEGLAKVSVFADGSGWFIKVCSMYHK